MSGGEANRYELLLGYAPRSYCIYSNGIELSLHLPGLMARWLPYYHSAKFIPADYIPRSCHKRRNWSRMLALPRKGLFIVDRELVRLAVDEVQRIHAASDYYHIIKPSRSSEIYLPRGILHVILGIMC